MSNQTKGMSQQIVSIQNILCDLSSVLYYVVITYLTTVEACSGHPTNGLNFFQS